MRWLSLLLMSIFPAWLVAGEQLLLPIHNIEAEHVDFDEKKILLTGNVKVAHEFGIIQCNEATLLLRQEKKPGEELPIEHIFLKGAVRIEFSKEHILFSDEGDIDCASLECFFCSAPPNMVIYIASSGALNIPLKATSRSLRGKIAKTTQGYELTSLQGEGMVHIEHLKKEPEEVAQT